LSNTPAYITNHGVAITTGMKDVGHRPRASHGTIFPVSCLTWSFVPYFVATMFRFVLVVAVSAVLCGLSTGAPTSYGSTTEAPSTTYTAVESVSSATTAVTSGDYQTKMESSNVHGSSMGTQSGGKGDCDKTKGSHAGKYGTPESQGGAPSTYPSSAKDESAPGSEQPLASYGPSATSEPSSTSEPSATGEPVASYGPSASYGPTASSGPSSPTTIAPTVYRTSYSSFHSDGHGHDSMSNGSMAYSPGTGGSM
jgi:hypothetical protein